MSFPRNDAELERLLPSLHWRDEKIDGVGPWVWVKDDIWGWKQPAEEWPALRELILANVKGRRGIIQAGELLRGPARLDRWRMPYCIFIVRVILDSKDSHELGGGGVSAFCESCRHWWRHSETCHRYPPVIVESKGMMGRWPITMKHESCGEHAPVPVIVPYATQIWREAVRKEAVRKETVRKAAKKRKPVRRSRKRRAGAV